ncbi:MAG: EAL domain-containing protein [Epsilonproteobacteria bacterium]|nr:EAL domain-containing protein [Campylobacterota bacterium]
MRKYLEVLNHYLPEILRKIGLTIREDNSIYEFIKNPDELDRLLHLQEKLITKYLKQALFVDIDQNTCKDLYMELKIPFAIVYKSLNLIKSELLKALNKEHVDSVEIYEFAKHFELFINLIAKIYIKKNIPKIKKIFKSNFKEHLLFQAHIQWANEIIESITQDKLDDFPITTANKCQFNHYLLYPQSLMICMDKNLCAYVERLHSMIHKLANSFYLFYIQEKFNEAYFIFKDLTENILRFTNTLGEFYFVAYADLEGSFFRLIETLQYRHNIHLTSINLKSIKKLNTIYGETLVSKAIAIIEDQLNRHFEHQQHKTLLIRGITSNFYMLNIAYTQETYQQELQHINQIITTPIVVDNKTISFEASIVGFKADRYSQITQLDLVKMLSFLQTQAKKQHKDILIYTNNTQELLKNILQDKYTEEFIINKLTNREIDIVFQPIYDQDQKLYTLEVLGRIKDTDGLIPASMFIDKIYELDKIDIFDTLVLEKLIQKKPLIEQVTNRLFINISFADLSNDTYLDKLTQLFVAFEMEIVLELTEQKFIENLDLIYDIHQKYQVKFAVDDFGSGYSSLQTVVDLAKKNILQIIKIDGVLVQNMKNDTYMQKIIKIISALGEELHVKIVAEYVEDQETFELLTNLHIDLFQGFYLSTPKPIEEMLLKV